MAGFVILGLIGGRAVTSVRPGVERLEARETLARDAVDHLFLVSRFKFQPSPVTGKLVRTALYVLLRFRTVTIACFSLLLTAIAMAGHETGFRVASRYIQA